LSIEYWLLIIGCWY